MIWLLDVWSMLGVNIAYEEPVEWVAYSLFGAIMLTFYSKILVDLLSRELNRVPR